MQAVILAGGSGSRLKPLTEKKPKVMVPVGSRPFLEYQILYLKKFDIRELVLCVSHLWEQIQSYFQDGSRWDVSIQYAVEQTPRGTGGALLNARHLLEDQFFLLYGDSFLPCDYGTLLSVFKRYGAPVLMTVYDNTLRTYVENNVALDKDNYIVLYAKGKHDERLSCVDAGVLLFQKEVLQEIPQEERVGLEEDFYPGLARERRLRAFISPQRFYDIGTPERLKEVRSVFHDHFEDTFSD